MSSAIEQAGTGTFSTRAAARIVAVTPARIRYWVRRQLLQPAAVMGRNYRFGFSELLVMRMAKELLPSRHHLRPVQQRLESLRRLLGSSRPVTSLKLANEDGRVLVRDGNFLLEADSGQFVFDFDSVTQPGVVRHGLGEQRIRRKLEQAQQAADVDPARALGLYREALEQEPNNFPAHFAIAQLLEADGELEQARQHLEAAAGLDGKNAAVHLKLGAIFFKQGDIHRSLEAYQLALECDPESAAAHRGLAEVYDRMGSERDVLRHLSALHRLTRGE